MEEMRTLAFQVPDSFFQRVKDYLHRHNMTQKDFVIGLIEQELDRDLAESQETGEAQGDFEDTEELENTEQLDADQELPGDQETASSAEEPDSYCIAGNIIDRQSKNGGNGFGYQEDISYTLNTTDRHAVYSRQRVDEFQESKVAGTESARQYKDATDLICQPEVNRNLIRRLTPLECERLQGFPDGWTLDRWGI